MIPARRVTLFSNWFAMYMRFRMRSYFNRLVVSPFMPREGHSILLLCNHFSWWDGLWGNYLAYWHLNRKLYIMMQEDHLQKRMLLNLFGGFSINRSSRAMIESLQYAANLLNNPQNLVVVFPQGKLISNHITEIEVERGIELLIKNIKGPCQIIYSCALIDYFESLKPSVFFHLFDCGIVGKTSFAKLTQQINEFHRQALKDQINVEH
jgi:1-acyl-sn-glycerol-3-phosphate acyltransferase